MKKTKENIPYFDYAASTPLLPEVKKVLEDSLRMFANPESPHRLGIEIKELLQNEIQQLATRLKIPSQSLVFTSGATESNNWVFYSLAISYLKKGNGKRPRILISSVEHPSVYQVVYHLAQLNLLEFQELPTNGNGIVEPDTLRKYLNKSVDLVSVIWVQNEVGTIQPVDELARIARNHGALFHTDATQALGKIDLGWSSSELKWKLKLKDLDFLTASSHKIYGPRGVGVLYWNPHRTELVPLIYGGGQQGGMRSGTPPVPLILGFLEALKFATDPMWLKSKREHMIKLKNKLWEFFQEQFRDDVQNHSHFEYTSPYFLCCSWKKMMLPKIFMTVAVGRGSACSQLKVKVENRALQAMGVDELRIRNSCRISFGWPTTENEIEKVKAFFRDWGGSH